MWHMPTRHHLGLPPEWGPIIGQGYMQVAAKRERYLRVQSNPGSFTWQPYSSLNFAPSSPCGIWGGVWEERGPLGPAPLTLWIGLRPWQSLGTSVKGPLVALTQGRKCFVLRPPKNSRLRHPDQDYE